MDRVDEGVGSDIYDSYDTKMACLLSARSAPGGENAKYRLRTDSCHRFTFFMFHFTFSFFFSFPPTVPPFKDRFPGQLVKTVCTL